MHFLSLFYHRRNFMIKGVHLCCKTSLSAINSSSVNVIPLPIFSRFGAQSLISYFGSRPFQLIKFSSFFHPFGYSDNTATLSIISYLYSAILLYPYTYIYYILLFSYILWSQTIHTQKRVPYSFESFLRIYIKQSFAGLPSL